MTWTNCSDKMPPNDDTRIILLYAEVFSEKSTGKSVHLASELVSRAHNSKRSINATWAHYTPELWEELNK